MADTDRRTAPKPQARKGVPVGLGLEPLHDLGVAADLEVSQDELLIDGKWQ
ncbi:MAG: hypothetical protein GTO31_13225 [Xanthomonadales bacterium]|nr:hypothetical protein [Xanthomonadales bacterium]